MKRPLTVVLMGYVASRLIFWLYADVSFDADSLHWFWQFIDPQLLAHDAIRSIYFLHAQPPLFNLYLATMIQLSGGEPLALFSLSFFALGLLMHGALFGLLRALGVRSWLAVAGTLLFAFSPASILYENWLFYTYPTAAILICAALSLHRVIDRRAAANARAKRFGASSARKKRTIRHRLFGKTSSALKSLSPGSAGLVPMI